MTVPALIAVGGCAMIPIWVWEAGDIIISHIVAAAVPHALESYMKRRLITLVAHIAMTYIVICGIYCIYGVRVEWGNVYSPTQNERIVMYVWICGATILMLGAVTDLFRCLSVRYRVEACLKDREYHRARIKSVTCGYMGIIGTMGTVIYIAQMKAHTVINVVIL
jgi:hypothetical protein